MISPKVRVNRNEGTGPGVWLMLVGLLAIPLISFIFSQPHTARYIGSAIYTLGVLWILLVTTAADRTNGDPYAPNFFVALTFCCVPLYFTLSAAGVVWWLRLTIAVAEGAASLVLFHIVFRRTLPQGRARKS